jgi:anhydro-N-acetylmuramic acid kinase
MNNAQRIYHISQKEKRNIIGLMSGTSLDGLDIALCTITGSGYDTKIEGIKFVTTSYTDEQKNNIKKIFTKSQIDLQYLTVLNEWIGRLHGEMINNALKSWGIANNEVDLIASHGQTIYHAPKTLHKLEEFDFDATLQIGDGDHVAVTTNIITFADFRQKHVAKGGEGAPLALYGDCLILGDKIKQRVLLNMGGISNYTFIPNIDSDFTAEASDIGTGNTLIDLYSKKYYNKEFDKDGLTARSGTLSHELLDSMLNDAFFQLPYPKSTGQEYFNDNWVQSHISKTVKTITNEDLMCTVTHFSAQSIARCLNELREKYGDFDIYLSGGGALNKFLCQLIKDSLPSHYVGISDELGVPVDAKEAILFAVLANECLTNENPNYNLIKKYGNFTMGKVCFPI